MPPTYPFRPPCVYADEPDDMAEQTQRLVDHWIEQAQERSVYLIIIPANLDDISQSPALGLVRKHNLRDRCIGVYTKADRADPDDDETGRPYAAFQDQVLGTGAATVDLGKFGYVVRWVGKWGCISVFFLPLQTLSLTSTKFLHNHNYCHTRAALLFHPHRV